MSAFSDKRTESIERYRVLVADGKNQAALWENLKNQIFLVIDAFVKKMQARVPVNKDLSEIPLGQRRPKPKSIEYYIARCNNRDEAIALAYDSGNYGLKK